MLNYLSSDLTAIECNFGTGWYVLFNFKLLEICNVIVKSTAVCQYLIMCLASLAEFLTCVLNTYAAK